MHKLVLRLAKLKKSNPGKFEKRDEELRVRLAEVHWNTLR